MLRLPLSRLLSLAMRQLRRDARAGELRVLFFALLVAVAASTAIGYFGARLNAAMTLRASEFLAADLVLQGSSEPAPAQLQAGEAAGLEHARTVEFTSVVATDNGIQLSSVKAVQAPYPLRGTLKSSDQAYGPEQAGGLPGQGEVWVEPRLLAALSLKVGDSVDVGAATLRIARVLTYEPDRAGNFYSLTPRVIMNLADLPATAVLQPGSRVTLRDLWRGSPEAIEQYRERLKADLAPNQQVLDARDSNRQIGGALGKAESYLNLASLVAVLLAGVAVALSANRYAQRRFDLSALLRCLGLARREALALFAVQLALLGVLASVAGALLGWGGQQVLFSLLAGLLPPDIPSGGPAPALSGIATGLVALAGFALPPLAALGRVPPLRVLRRDLAPRAPANWLVQGTALLALGLIMWRLSLNLPLTLALLGGGALAALVLGAALVASLHLLRRWLARAPLAWRLGLGQLLRHPAAAAGQALAFGLILFAMALVALLRIELLDTWQKQLPQDAPNYFALNILPAEQQGFADHLKTLGAVAAPMYPVIPGRLVQIDGKPVEQVVQADSRGERATQRDLSLTWAAELPPGNRIAQGQWWKAGQADDLPGVSVEAELASSLNLRLGSVLIFNVGGSQREVRVTSLREVNWDNFQPNFFMIFQPGTLQGLPATYLTSFYLRPGQDTAIVGLSRAFPATTLLQVEAILGQLRSILTQVTLAVQFVLLFVLAAGVTVLFSGLQATLDERLHQGALLRALGARRALLQRARRIEFALLGAASGVIAAVACEAASWALYRFAFRLEWAPHPWLLVLPALGAALIGVAGLLGTRRALTASPLVVLREA